MFNIIFLVFSFIFPAFPILASKNKPGSQLLIESFICSTSFNILTALILLHLSAFNLINFNFVIWSLAIVGIFTNFNNFKSVIKNYQITIFPLLLSVVFVALFAISSKSSYLISFGMDAGNYELYANHFNNTGSYFLEHKDFSSGLKENFLAKKGWSGNVHNQFIQSYFFSYPVFVGIGKLYLNSLHSSYYLNIFLLFFIVFISSFIAAKISKKLIISIFSVLIATATPILFLYTKMPMSEILTLVGILGICFSVFYNCSYLTIIASSIIVSTTKLEYFHLSLLFNASLLGFLFIEKQKDNINKHHLSFSIATIISAIILKLTTSKHYLSIYNPFGISYKDKLNLIEQEVPFIFIVALISLIISLIIKLKLHQKLSMTKFKNLVYIILFLGIESFLVWNLVYRYNFSLQEEGTFVHDKINLFRLLKVFSPLLLAGLAFVPFIIQKSKTILEKSLLLTLSTQLLLLIFKSFHSSAEIWWSRRYLGVCFPLLLIFIPYLYSFLKNKKDRVYLFALCTLLSIAPMYNSSIILNSKLSPIKPKVYKKISNVIDKDSIIFYPKLSFIRLGVANYYSSLHKGFSFFNIKEENIIKSAKKFKQKVYFISPTKLTSIKNMKFIKRVSFRFRSYLTYENIYNKKPHLADQALFIYQINKET